MNLKINLFYSNKMGLYLSEDGKHCTSTLDFPPTSHVTTKELRDNNAAIVIQKWWKKTNKLTSNRKRKYDDMIYLDNEDYNSELETELETELDNISLKSEEEDKEDKELETIVYNNFLLDLWYSFYNFIVKLLM